jgi:mRNA interferase MazF
MVTYPKQGDIVVVDAEPHAGREMGGHAPREGNVRRHYVVLSGTPYNNNVGMIIGMPITTSVRYEGNPRYLPILIMAGIDSVKGYVVTWQLQNFDFEARNGKIIGQASSKMIKKLKFIVSDLFEI